MKFKWLAVSTALAVTLACSAHAGQAKPQTQKEDMKNGQWLQFRGDRALTGRSSLKGNITSPEIKWKHFIGGRETLLTATPGGKSTSVKLPNSDLNADNITTILQDWGATSTTWDLDENGKKTTIVSYCHHKISKWVPEWPGLQKVQTDSGFSIDYEKNDLYCRLYRRENGDWKEVWRSEPVPLMFCGEPIVGDFDNDGKLEVAIMPWYDIWVLDFATGKTKYKARFTPEGQNHGRGYGYFIAKDLNGDGKTEFIVHSDMQSQVNVLGWDSEGKLVKLWDHVFDYLKLGGGIRTTMLQAIPEMAQDVDGDSRPEIVLSIYNEKEDDKYHTLVFDAMTGDIKLDMPDQCMIGMADIDGDGVAEMLCSHSRGKVAPDASEISAFSFKNKKLSTIWQQTGASFQSQMRHSLPDNINSTAQPSYYPLLIGPITPSTRPVFVTRKVINRHSSEVELDAWQAGTDGKIQKICTLNGPNLEAVAIKMDKTSPQVLVRASSPGKSKTRMTADNANVTMISSHSIAAPSSPVLVASLDGKSRPTAVAQTACEQLVAFRPPVGKKNAKELWHAPGRGSYFGGYYAGMMFFGVMLADVLGNGQLQTVAATRTPEGFARLVVLDPKGKEVWHYDITSLPGNPPPWNTPGLLFWSVGNFTSPDHGDIWLSYRPNNASESVLLDGRTGKPGWHCNESRKGIGCGGFLASIFDVDGNGLDDIYSFYAGSIHAVNGVTGKLMFDPLITFGDDMPFKHAEGGYTPVVDDLLGNGKKQILMAAGNGVFALLDLDRKVLWETYLDDGKPPFATGAMPAIGDIDGDGKLELTGTSAVKGEFHCYDATTGQLKWKLTEGSTSDQAAVSCDIDGDGREETIQAQGTTLYAVGTTQDGKSGIVKWKISLPSTIGPLSIADADGTGKPQIITVCQDGNIYGIGSRN